LKALISLYRPLSEAAHPSRTFFLFSISFRERERETERDREKEKEREKEREHALSLSLARFLSHFLSQQPLSHSARRLALRGMRRLPGLVPLENLLEILLRLLIAHLGYRIEVSTRWYCG
jgi:hypothetical protein